MKRLAVAIGLVVIALCTPALGQVWGWEWYQQYPDSAWDPDQYSPSNLFLTKNNGSHAVAIGHSNGVWWTGAVAAVGQVDDEEHNDSITAYEWVDDGHYDRENDGWPYRIWEDNNQYPHPGEACVAANDNYKLWLSSAHGLTGIYRIMCNAASADLWDQVVDHRDHLTDSWHVNWDNWLTGVCFPNSERMVAAYPDNYEYPTGNHDLLANTTTNHGGSWSNWIRILDDPVYESDASSAPSLAVGDGADAYIVYQKNGDPDADTVIFKKSTDWGGSWPSDAGGIPLGVGPDLRPCIAALGSFVFVCWHNSTGKIAYRFSNQAGGSGTWSAEATIGPTGMSHINVSALACTHHTGEPPGVLVVSQWDYGDPSKSYVVGYFGERFETSHLDWYGTAFTGGYSEGELRPSLATARADQDHDYVGRCVHNPKMFNGKRGVHLRRGTWTELEA
jgi:hypothetical protein